ncbi:LysR family transcriptional regulator [Bordetella avium]|uniref:LysR family transcriptional regulator n=1 Tax=Bordetella avium TaxID=521 RepID=UPI000E0BC6A2|nr:LysR family transcriptional regulator [Bordetella avium]RIQ14854.1 LysR family transcriptional regulator [Bordetella avium]RIQ41319.1 LysR family transcriptional regulator [Bordetella avium]RIQ45894.1 LysR family transcriptional regulator [Bordetella avium]RIQ46820.1 LysR family transcriptional regulator [Bordetella avium]RIQ49656.1 LysR family transcriptional regulator [Bordetella avium]
MLNYRHLYYFWAVAKEGGFARAAERLDMAIQTISAQVRELERSLGHQLLKPHGRGVALTEAGEAAFARAEEIFQIGQSLADEVRAAASRPIQRLAIGLSDGISKLAVHALLQPVLDTPDLRLICHDGEVDELLGELARHHLDLVLTGQGAPPNPNLRLSSERLVSSPVDWYGPVRWTRRNDVSGFPQTLARLPVLLPTRHAVLRQTLDRWFEEQGIVPHVVGEFEDSALMAVFAVRGLGVFPLSRLGGEGLLNNLRLLGRCDGAHEEIHAIRNRRGQRHPLVQRILEQAATSS